MAIHKKPTNIEEVCNTIKISARLLGFKFIKYKKLKKDDKLKIEEVVLDMMSAFKLTP